MKCASLEMNCEKKLSCYRYGKRVFDIFFSLLALWLSFPLFLGIALCIRLSSPGPILYSSMRIGRGGQVFKFWKFRTMYVDAEHKLTALLRDNPVLNEEWKTFFKLKNDPRLTPVGKILRKSSLDELPQFWNVLRGDLSVVGPRPFLPNETSEIKKIIGNKTDQLFSPQPGITGIWQTSGRSNLSFEKRVLLDLHYTNKCSFMFDLKIIAKTIPMILFSKGAF